MNLNRFCILSCIAGALAIFAPTLSRAEWEGVCSELECATKTYPLNYEVPLDVSRISIGAVEDEVLKEARSKVEALANGFTQNCTNFIDQLTIVYQTCPYSSDTTSQEDESGK